jgi:hypothetical protein
MASLATTSFPTVVHAASRATGSLFAAWFAAASLAGLCARAPAQEGVLGGAGPVAHMVAALAVDTDGDGRAELVLVDRAGAVTRYRLREGGGLAPDGMVQLRDPMHTLFSAADLLADPGVEIVVADSAGTGTIAWTTGEVKPLVRRARLSLRTDQPRRALLRVPAVAGSRKRGDLGHRRRYRRHRRYRGQRRRRADAGFPPTSRAGERLGRRNADPARQLWLLQRPGRSRDHRPDSHQRQ